MTTSTKPEPATNNAPPPPSDREQLEQAHRDNSVLRSRLNAALSVEGAGAHADKVAALSSAAARAAAELHGLNDELAEELGNAVIALSKLPADAQPTE